MKSVPVFVRLAACVAATLVACGEGAQFRGSAARGRAVGGTISQVISLLQDMMEKSKLEGESERDLYAKFKCYCDDNTKEKKQTIEDATTQIGLLGNDVAGLQASNGELSAKAAQLQADMDGNEQARTSAEAMRTKEQEAFVAEEADLQGAVDQLQQAIDALSALGADQTLTEASAEHKAFMADYDSKKNKAAMLGLRDTVQKALLAASSFRTTSAQQKDIQAFLQSKAPFSETYSSQAGGVVGILKGMKETFEENLQSARANEAAAVESHGKFMETKQGEFDTLKESHDGKQALMGNNDGDLATKKDLLVAAQQSKEDAEAFLESLGDMCGKKAKEYDQRTALRVSEQAAISKAIALLNNDHSFETFGKVAATSTGPTSLMQVSMARSARSAVQRRLAARRFLTTLGPRTGRLRRVASLLALGNPFNKVFEEVDKMKLLIIEEAEKDAKQKSWCEGEQTNGKANLQTKTTEITELGSAITDLGTAIEDPEVGLRVTIAADEKSIDDNRKAQKDETEVRAKENKDYRTNVQNCVDSQKILTKAISALEVYYKKVEDEEREELGFAQKRKEEPAPPETWSEGKYEGQSDSGNSVIDMLQFILSEAGKEEAVAHQTEAEAQGAFEDSMASLKQEEKDTLEAIAKGKEDLAAKLEELEMKHADLTQTEKEKLSIEHYLQQIEPGCSWITTNFDTREANRATEKAALERAVDLIKATPAHAAAAAASKEEAFGECAEKCKSNDAHVDCKACMAKVSVPGYCAGHPATAGC